MSSGKGCSEGFLSKGLVEASDCGLFAATEGPAGPWEGLLGVGVEAEVLGGAVTTDADFSRPLLSIKSGVADSSAVGVYAGVAKTSDNSGAFDLPTVPSNMVTRIVLYLKLVVQREGDASTKTCLPSAVIEDNVRLPLDVRHIRIGGRRECAGTNSSVGRVVDYFVYMRRRPGIRVNFVLLKWHAIESGQMKSQPASGLFAVVLCCHQLLVSLDALAWFCSAISGTKIKGNGK